MTKKKQLRAILETSKGAIHLNLFAEQAPVTVANFVNLAQRGYYSGLGFHRVLADFMVQGGCPKGDGRGGPGYTFQDETESGLHHDRPGTLSMANAGPGTNGSQFFITHVPTPWLDGNHTIFGVVAGDEDQAVVNKIQQRDRITNVVIEGDSGELLAAQKTRVDAWNQVLDRNFSHLK